MTPALLHAADLAALTAGYWAVDRLLRRDGYVRLMTRLGAARPDLQVAVFAVPWLALAPSWRWEAIPQGGVLRIFALFLVAILAWKATTRDIDLVIGERHVLARWLLVGSVPLLWTSPAFLPLAALLLTQPFGLWEHHATFPMRVTQALVAYACLAGALGPTPLFGDATALLFFVLVIQISHYLITALAKCLLGPKWTSWVSDNKLHHMAASAYSWGWARFFPWSRWRRVIDGLKAVEKPLQLTTFGIELLAPLALLHPTAAIGFCLAWCAFHLGVFAVSGLLFWDWILTNLSIAVLVSSIPPPIAEQAFGPWSMLAGLLFLLLFPLRHKLWTPMPLGWFDSPFTQRIHWQVEGESGNLYGLYNDFMCPHERLYGKVHGCFLAPVPVVTYHLGEVWKPELRDAIRAAGPSLERLEGVRRRFGIEPKNAPMAARHEQYLRRFFHELNRGARKHVLPRPLRFLKAPGDQIFYWGDLPRYRGQEKVRKVVLRYREEYFDGAELRRLRDEPVLEIDLEVGPVPEPVRELTPKEIDDYLLRLAKGKLIDLPGAGGGYVKTDDGKVQPLSPRAR